MAELINPSSYNDFTLQTLMTPDGITRLNSLLSQLSQNIAGDTENVRVFQGVGTPEASIAAGVGSLYMRTDGGTDTSIYRKESGSGNTGWVAIKAPASLPLSVANGGTGADNSAVAQGYIPYMSATGVISWLAVGTSGKVLVTQGAGANPTWGVAGGNYAAGTYNLLKGVIPVDLNVTSATYVKIFEIYLPRAGTLTVSFKLDQNAGGTGYGRVYRNGNAVGTEQSVASGAPAVKSESISGWSAGDLLQIYSKNVGGSKTSVGDILISEDSPNTEIISTTRASIWSGTGDPNINIGAVGDIYLNLSGGASTTLWVKTAATTWTAK